MSRPESSARSQKPCLGVYSSNQHQSHSNQPRKGLSFLDISALGGSYDAHTAFVVDAGGREFCIGLTVAEDVGRRLAAEDEHEDSEESRHGVQTQPNFAQQLEAFEGADSANCCSC